MHRQLWTRIADAVAAGQRVIYFGPNHPAGRHALMAVDDELAGRGVLCQARWTNGMERLTTETGGSLVIASRIVGVHGRVADVVFVDCAATPALLASLQPCIASTHGELIHS